MSRVKIMPEILASQVAAGEVIDRPASVIKELIENSLDAKASIIRIDIHRGGISLIRVTDNGSGMNKDDALMCLERHATSKLFCLEDLQAIHHLGFRGEAIPSIASVSRFRLETRLHDAAQGTAIKIEGGKILDVRSAGGAPGTKIEVSDLFFNIPARRKFLRTAETESSHIEQQIRLLALSSPSTRFIFSKDDRLIFDLPPAEDWRSRISALEGSRIGSLLLPIEPFSGMGFELSGWLLPESECRKGKKSQFFFLNGRPIEDSILSRAVKDGFPGLLQGLWPSIYLKISMEPGLVDVNVHPAKREVRFRRPMDLTSGICAAVRQAATPKFQGNPANLISQQKPQTQGFTLDPKFRQFQTEKPLISAPISIPPNSANTGKIISSYKEKEITQTILPTPKTPTKVIPELLPKETPASKSLAPKWQFKGTLGTKYFLWEGSDGLVLMNISAARMRIIYENFLATQNGTPVTVQPLLLPLALEFSANDKLLIDKNQTWFEDAGLPLHHFGGNTFQLEAIPIWLKIEDSRAFLLSLIDDLSESFSPRQSGKQHAFQQFAQKVASRAARCESSQAFEPSTLLQQLFSCEQPYATPDNRPTLISYDWYELDRKFGNSH